MPNKSVFNKYFQLVIKIVEELKGFESPVKTAENQCNLIAQYIDLETVNSHIAGKDLSDLKEVQRSYIMVWMRKAILDADLLRDLCLLTPVGVSLDQWHCFLSSCKDK